MNKIDDMIRKLLEQLSLEEIDRSEFLIRFLKSDKEIMFNILEEFVPLFIGIILKDIKELKEKYYENFQELKKTIGIDEATYLSLAMIQHISQNFLGGLHSDPTCNGRLDLVLSNLKLYLYCHGCQHQWIIGIAREVAGLGDP